ncbi:hypothetical protein [Legionella pneumophila]|uniref:Type IV secretion protein Dot n=1 Tax=Legionella pneumophila subsp. pascullei TaxID=91890 RepID=A0AAX2IZ18_LEGPN|nr:hypothetical protein [Legionella pneumophila]AMP90765.1 hypothetical protein AXF35_14135 [Legionella pneumophila subsp. pascullei]AMP93749.1 hypothetical protein AXF36_14500 [Legionella pneumophila subsp. pascullei]AMP96666.1 hypothetical protein AXF37_14135 [Legionella pneumophila subsp. pascullei]SQG91712.1 Uncharacterised protein [Legionella pneumophila subsp. pascullei]VEH08258.1 Uncharacterised protein [Legionella pneumophila subsp. pascullei]
MKISELKKMVAELNKEVSGEAHCANIINLAGNLSEIIEYFEQDEHVSPELIYKIETVIYEFWKIVSNTLPYEEWQNSIQVAPWLTLQRSLVKAGLLPTDFHHPILYQHLKEHYEKLGNSPLGIDQLLPLLIRSSRMTGYANKDPHSLDIYPHSQLNKQIEAKRPQELAKLKDILCLLRASFYLIYHYCTIEQLALIPYLIYFRNPTTDEERRSELAIFNWLTQKTADCLEFFKINEDYIDTRSLRQINELGSLRPFIPTARGDFIKLTNKEHWIYPFIQSRTNTPSSEFDLLNDTVNWIDTDFETEKVKSYQAALEFAHTVKKQASILTQRERKLVHAALYVFCLDKYIKQRKEDPRLRCTPFSLSGETKCRAAEKKQQEILGKPVKFGFFENLALNEGRLKNLTKTFETPELTY